MVLGLCMGWVFGIFSFRKSGVPYELTFGLLNGLQVRLLPVVGKFLSATFHWYEPMRQWIYCMMGFLVVPSPRGSEVFIQWLWNFSRPHFTEMNLWDSEYWRAFRDCFFSLVVAAPRPTYPHAYTNTSDYYQQIVIVALFQPKCLVSFQRIAFPETLNSELEAYHCCFARCPERVAMKSSAAANALRLQARDAVWCKCKRPQSSIRNVEEIRTAALLAARQS